MASRIGLSQFVNAELLQTLSGGNLRSQDSKSSARPPESTISSSLRLGSQTYSTAVKSLNSASTFINLSKETLEKLDTIVTDLIDLAKRATSPTMTQSNREAINKQFGKLVEDYQDVVDNASAQELEYLTTGGLEVIFEAAGLDAETSGSVAQLFEEFVTVPDDPRNSLASQKNVILNQGFIPATTLTEDYTDQPLARVTGAKASIGFVSKEGSVFQAKDGYALQTPGYESLIIQDKLGQTSAFPGLEGDGSFASPLTTTTDAATSIVSGDFDLDGRTDFIQSSATGGKFYRGTDTGAFSESSSFAVGSSIENIVAADFNNDGISDVVSSTSSSTIGIYTGDGTGNFSESSTFAIPNASTSLADLKTTDINKDGNADLIGLDATTDTIEVMLGNGDGTFGASTSFGTLITGGTELTLGDIDGDGNEDIVITTAGGTSQLLGNGNGTFAAATTSVAAGAKATVLADFDLDGDLDQVSIDSGSDTIRVSSNDGTGTFTAAATTFLGNLGATSLSVGQFDSGNSLDIAVAGSTGVQYFAGTEGDIAAFNSIATVSTSGANTVITAADSNNDGVDDILAAGTTTTDIINTNTQIVDLELDRNITLLDVNKENGYSLVTTTQNLLGENFIESARAFLVDSTGKVIQQYTNLTTYTEISDGSLTENNQKMAMIANNGINTEVRLSILPVEGTFQYDRSETQSPTLESASMATTIFSDIEIGDDGSYAAYLRDVSGTSSLSFRTANFAATEDAFLAGETDKNNYFGFVESDRILIAQDTDANGSADRILSYGYGDAAYGTTLVDGVDVTEFTTLEDNTSSGQGYFAFVDANTNTINVFREGTANSLYTVELGDNDTVSSLSLTYDQANNVELGVFGSLPSMADTADPELFRASITETTSQVSQGVGTFSTTSTFAPVGTYNNSVVADLDGDGNDDIISTTAASTTAVELGNGDGTFAATVTSTRGGGSGQAITIGDINNDGEIDILTADSAGVIAIQTGNGDGTFAAGTTYGTTLTGASDIQLADFNNDGNLDFIASTADTLYIARGKGDGTFLSARSFATGGSGIADIEVGDLNNDGNIDVAVSDPGNGEYYTFTGNGKGDISLADSDSFTADEIRLADFNNDGVLDLLAARGASGDAVSILEGNGDGTFSSSVFSGSVGIGGAATDVQVADINQDGLLDFVIGGNDGANDVVQTFTGDGTFNFTQATPITPLSSSVGNIVLGEFNSDGATDITVAKTAEFETFTQDTSGTTRQSTATINTADNSPQRPTYTARTLVTSIFDSGRNLLNRSDAFAILKDLEKLQDQIETNLKTLDEGTEIIQLNIEIARAAGIGLLELSNEASSEDTAESLALKLQVKIRNNATEALSQAENLSPLAAAALLAG